jgi:hypothetical protein
MQHAFNFSERGLPWFLELDETLNLPPPIPIFSLHTRHQSWSFPKVCQKEAWPAKLHSEGENNVLAWKQTPQVHKPGSLTLPVDCATLLFWKLHEHFV